MIFCPYVRIWFAIELISFFSSMEIKMEPGLEGALVPRPVKERKKHDRFNGMSEEEVSRRTLPDHLAENLDIIIVSMIAVWQHFVL